MLSHVRRLMRDSRGATSIEYAIIAAVMAVVLVAVLETLSGSVGGKWNSVSDAFTASSGGGSQ